MPFGVDALAVFGDDTFRIGVVHAAHREVDAALAVGRQIVDDATDAVERFALIHVREHPALGDQLRHRRAKPTLDDEQLVLRVHRQRAAGAGVGVRDRRFARRVELHDLAVVVLREQQSAISGAEDAVAVVAGLLPEERPLLTRSDDAGNLRHLVFPHARHRRGGTAATPAGTASSAASGRRRLARRDQRGIAGIGWRLHQRGRRIRGRCRQPRRLTLRERGQRSSHGHRDDEHTFGLHRASRMRQHIPKPFRHLRLECC